MGGETRSIGSRLPASFYAGDAIEVARALLGKRLRRGAVTLEITEVEAYPPGDSAAHSRHGRTARNDPMWGPPGHAYVYLCYGVHQMLNIVTNADGVPGAVLIRACRPAPTMELGPKGERAMEEIRTRRGGRSGPNLLNGPGKVAQALALDRSFNGHRLFAAGGLACLDATPPAAILTGPRIGIDYAKAEDIAAPQRFAIANCAWVSHRTGLGREPE